jgi:hypothetical protein
MNARSLIAFFAGAALLGLSACNTPRAVDAQPASNPVPPQLTIPLPMYELRDGKLVPPPDAERGQICQLGTSCLTMDPRPFEPCLLSTKHCRDKATEPLLVGSPQVIVPAPQVESR